MSEEQPPVLPPRRKLDIEQPIGVGGMGRQAAIAMYALVTLALIGVALYMAVVERAPLATGWVVAPAIGAAWFGLRLFMMMNSGK